MKKTIMLIPILFVLGFSLLSAEQKVGVFVGISPLHSGSGAFAYEDTYMSGDFTSISSGTSNESIGNGLGLKVGYNLQDWRISYNTFTWNFKNDVKISNNLVIANYVFNSGFYLGVGTGNGTISINTVSKSGSAFGYNLGYDWNINEQFQVGLGYLLSGFGYSIDNSSGNVTHKTDVGIGIATLFVDITYRF